MSVRATNVYWFSALFHVSYCALEYGSEAGRYSDTSALKRLVGQFNEKAEVKLQWPQKMNWWNSLVIYLRLFFKPFPLSLLPTKAPLQLIWTTPLPPHPLSGAALEYCHGVFFPGLGRWCGLLLSVPLTSILSVKNGIPHCRKQHFANQFSWESHLMEHYREQNRKFQQICFSNFLKESQIKLALWWKVFCLGYNNKHLLPITGEYSERMPLYFLVPFSSIIAHGLPHCFKHLKSALF